jgi:hypothetical protein
MTGKIALVVSLLLVTVSAASQRPTVLQAAPQPHAARLLVQGVYEETYRGTVSEGNAEGKLLIKFEAGRWLTLTTNEVGNAEFSDLANAPAPTVSGSVSYDGRVKGGSGGGESTNAESHLTGPLGAGDVTLSVPEYNDTGNGYKIRVFINPKLKGKCKFVSTRGGETATAEGCDNGTYFFTASSPIQTDDNDDPSKTADTPNIATFGIELDVEPEPAAASNPAASSPAEQGDAGIYAWRGAVTNGSKETGFKIDLVKTKDLPSDDKRGRSTRKLTFSATIVPGAPGQ